MPSSSAAHRWGSGPDGTVSRIRSIPAVGIKVIAKPGDELRAGDPVLELHYRDRGRLDRAIALATRAIQMGDGRPSAAPLIVGEVR